MSMSDLRLPVLLAIIFTSAAISPVLSAGDFRSNWERLSHPPFDSVQARDTRIWFGLHHEGRCRVRVQVLDTAQNVVRQVTDTMLTRGYFNLYWDKRDDSGSYVVRGLYFYRAVSGCAPEAKGKLWASYRPFERVVRMMVDTADKEAAFSVVVDTPAVRVSLDVYTIQGTLIDSLCPDTVLTSGSHRFVWQPPYGTALGFYCIRMNVEGFVVQEKVRLR